MRPAAGAARDAEGRERAVAVGLVLVAALSPQVGAAFAVTLFDELGPAGAAFLRLAFAAIVLWAVWRPRLTGERRVTGDLRLVAAFGASLGLMNWSFYEAIARIPLGIAVTIEFAGPLLVAVIGSRRPLDGVWIALAAVGIVLLLGPGGGSLDPAGIGFAVAAAVCWMAYVYLSKRTGAAFPGGSGLALAMAVAALIGFCSIATSSSITCAATIGSWPPATSFTSPPSLGRSSSPVAALKSAASGGCSSR